MEEQKVSKFTDDQLRRLQEDESNIVYDVTYDSVDRVVPMKEMKTTIGKIRDAHISLRKEHPGWSDDEIRTEIRKGDKDAESMASLTHPKLFKTITDRNATDEDCQMVAYVIHLRERVERGEISEDDGFALLYRHLNDQDIKK